MNLMTMIANWFLKYLELTPTDVQEALAKANDDWGLLVRQMAEIDPRIRGFIADGLEEKGFAADTLPDPHMVVAGDYDAKIAAWVLLTHMHGLYTGDVAGLDPSLNDLGSYIRKPLEQLIMAALQTVAVHNIMCPEFLQGQAELREALIALQGDRGFAALVNGTVQVLHDKAVSQSRG